MATTLATVNNLINDRRRDTGTNSVNMTTVGFRAINQTLLLWQQLHDWEFTIEEQLVDYNQGIMHYALNSDYKSPYDMRPYKGSRKQEFDMVSQSNFDSEELKKNRFAISVKAQTERLRIQSSLGNKAPLHTATTYDGNGTWVASGDASNVTTDTNEYFELSGSVNFDGNGTSMVMTNSTFTSIDLSDYEDRSNVYFNIYLPTVTNLTSITLRFGSSASAYWTETITSDYLTDSFIVGWNKLKADWGTKVGSPDSSAIDYLQVTLTWSQSTTDTDFRLENFFCSENVPLIFQYYSTNMVKDASDGTKRQVFDDAASTTDLFLWSGKWDFVTEGFVDSVLEYIFWITGEQEDFNIARIKIQEIVNNLRVRLPSRRRYAEMQFEIE